MKLVFLPVTNAWNFHLLYVQHSQAMLECGVFELVHSFFHFSWVFLVTIFPWVLTFLYASLWRCHVVHLFVCPGLVGRTVNSRILQLNAFCVIQGQRSRSYSHIIGKRWRQDTEWTISSRIIQLGTIDDHAERNAYSFSRSKVKVELSHSRKKWQNTL